jgi:nucleoside-triphosphatase THEP1
MRVNYFYDKDTFEAKIEIINNKGIKFIGKAIAHPDDQDYANQFSGLYIAEIRARIKRENYKITKTKAEIRRLQNELKYKEKLLSEYESNRQYFRKIAEEFIESKESLYKQFRAYKDNEERDK